MKIMPLWLSPKLHAWSEESYETQTRIWNKFAVMNLFCRLNLLVTRWLCPLIKPLSPEFCVSAESVLPFSIVKMKTKKYCGLIKGIESDFELALFKEVSWDHWCYSSWQLELNCKVLFYWIPSHSTMLWKMVSELNMDQFEYLFFTIFYDAVTSAVHTTTYRRRAWKFGKVLSQKCSRCAGTHRGNTWLTVSNASQTR